MERKITRMYTDSEGETHFEEMTIPLKDAEGFFSWSDPVKATGIIFGELHSEKFNDWHNVPRRQFVVTVEGEAEFGVSDGTKKVFKPGDIMLAEDLTGKGHTRLLKSKQGHKVVIITLD